MREKKRHFVLAALFLAILGYAAYRLSRSDFAWPVFFAAFRNVDWAWLLASVGLTYASHLGRSARWEVMLRPVRREVPLGGLLSATIVGFTAVVLLGRAGEVVRPYLIANKANVSFSSQMAAWLLERIFDLLMILLLFGYALAVVPASRLHLGPGLTWVFRTGGYVCAAICTLCVLALVAFRWFSGSVRERLASSLAFLPERYHGRAVRFAESFGEGAQSASETRFLLLLLADSALLWMAIVVGYFCLFRAIPSTASFRLDQVVVFIGLVAFGSAVQIPGVGGGFQVAAILVLHEIFGLRFETATGLSVLLWVAAFLPVVPVGLFLAFHEGLSWRKIRMIRSDLEPTKTS